MHKNENHITIRVEALSGEHFVLRALIVVLAFCIVAYVYFIGLSIMNVISNREASVESERLQSIVGDLEKEYFTLAKAVTPDLGANFGLAKAESPDFVRRATSMATNQAKSDI
jgi:hypothetical protein